MKSQKNSKQKPLPAEDKKPVSPESDSLLQSLVFLTRHYGRAKSPRSLSAGPAYDGLQMTPELFCQAAANIDLKTKIVKASGLHKISAAVLPAVLILDGSKACVLISLSAGKAEIYDPQDDSRKAIKTEALDQRFAGYVILIQPRPEFLNPQAAEEENRHDPSRHWFWSLVRENRGIYGMVLLAAVFINLFGLASPLFIKNVYDRVIPNSAIETGWALGIGALVVFAFDLIMRSLRSYLIDLAGRRMDVIATRRIYDQVLNIRLSERPKSSGAFANMLRDFDTVRDFFTSATITVLVDLPFTLFFLFIIYQLGGPLAFVIVGIIGSVFLVGLVLQGSLKAVVRKAARSAEAKHGLLVETIHGLETIKAIGADGRFRLRYGSLVGENAAYGQSSRFISGLGVNIATFLQQSATIIIVLVGMYLVADKSLTMGGLIACVLLSGRALAPIGQIANLMSRYHQAGGALKTLENVMNKPVERPHSTNFLHRPDLQGKITFDDVSFSYPSSGQEVLSHLSFTINPGERVGIIGRIGSGKSTTARLMMGLYQPTSGKILADDTDYRQIDPADLRRSLAYIAQDVVLFSGSVRDNIAASQPAVTEEEILNVSKAAGVHDFISRHPMGYDAQVGEHGEGLSGGQRQAIALARAMLINPTVLVCDEPTNAMDSQAEAVFKRYIEEEIKDRTFILVTHKHAMLELVDRLIVMEQGRVVLDGPRGEVAAKLQGTGGDA